MPSIAIIGGGPAGSLLAILLARRGLSPVVYERSPPFVPSLLAGGRSINLALAARGINALRHAGVDAEVTDLMIAMRGRMLAQGDLRLIALRRDAVDIGAGLAVEEGQHERQRGRDLCLAVLARHLDVRLAKPAQASAVLPAE